MSNLVVQGWQVIGYSVSDAGGETYQHNVLLAREGEHKVLTVRKKFMGEGVVSTEMDV
ncbi:hypothetical protein [Brevundimonas sp.]|uniref:hypothetical protein n=1 Tax=Brevundimonas sp. TaxID=1871086 RepID=UPI0035B44BA4